MMRDAKPLDAWVLTAMTSEVGDIGQLPMTVQKHLIAVYSEFSIAYLEWLRIREHQPGDWYPHIAVFEEELLQSMCHFWSNHQGIVRHIKSLRGLVRRLKNIDAERRPIAHDELVRQIIHGISKGASFNRIYPYIRDG